VSKDLLQKWCSSGLKVRAVGNDGNIVVQETSTRVQKNIGNDNKNVSISSIDKNVKSTDDIIKNEIKYFEEIDFGTNKNKKEETLDTGAYSTGGHTPEWSLVVKKKNKKLQYRKPVY
jgi:hypothetical protein